MTEFAALRGQSASKPKLPLIFELREFAAFCERREKARSARYQRKVSEAELKEGTCSRRSPFEINAVLYFCC